MCIFLPPRPIYYVFLTIRLTIGRVSACHLWAMTGTRCAAVLAVSPWWPAPHRAASVCSLSYSLFFLFCVVVVCFPEFPFASCGGYFIITLRPFCIYSPGVAGLPPRARPSMVNHPSAAPSCTPGADGFCMSVSPGTVSSMNPT